MKIRRACPYCEKQTDSVQQRWDYMRKAAGIMCDNCWAASGLNPANGLSQCWSCGKSKTECPDLQCLEPGKKNETGAKVIDITTQRGNNDASGN